MRIQALWSRRFLTNRVILWLLFIFNFLGTVYGYIWYGSQLQYTAEHNPLWMLVFVPDSPTASLLFTLSVGILLLEPYVSVWAPLRKLIEALAVVTSIKYGIWAVTIIFAGAYQGDVLMWKDYMLVASHLAMAVEALLYIRFFICDTWTIMIAAAWTFLNDMMDYTFDIFPWLPGVLQDDVLAVQNFTFLLTLLCSAISYIAVRKAGRL